MEIKDRIKSIMEKENILSGVFADSIGVQQSTLSHILNGRNKPSLDVVMKIHQRYHYINLEWLLYGTGHMVIGSGKHSSSGTKTAGDFPLFADVFLADGKDKDTKPTEKPAHEPKKAEVHVAPAAKEIIKQEIRYIEKQSRKITEIRIFFDDNTYEIFKSDR